MREGERGREREREREEGEKGRAAKLSWSRPFRFTQSVIAVGSGRHAAFLTCVLPSDCFAVTYKQVSRFEMQQAVSLPSPITGNIIYLAVIH